MTVYVLLLCCTGLGGCGLILDPILNPLLVDDGPPPPGQYDFLSPDSPKEAERRREWLAEREARDRKTADQRQAALYTRAERGGAEAQYRLGRYFYEMTFELQGHARDDSAGRAWFWTCLAANNGLPAAQSLLGFWLSREGSGLRIAPDQMGIREAYLWYSLAAARGRSEAEAGKAKLADIMSPSDVAEAEHLVSEWQPDPAVCGAKQGVQVSNQRGQTRLISSF